MLIRNTGNYITYNFQCIYNHVKKDWPDSIYVITSFKHENFINFFQIEYCTLKPSSISIWWNKIEDG